ncbi:hypothetical protein EDB89DRAFT_1905926 [Lactarius sanguifluus]|nr:hypothetical protein EDB89DRAFT_1905926 [Lactarius sanguifluus]
MSVIFMVTLGSHWPNSGGSGSDVAVDLVNICGRPTPIRRRVVTGRAAARNLGPRRAGVVGGEALADVAGWPVDAEVEVSEVEGRKRLTFGTRPQRGGGGGMGRECGEKVQDWGGSTEGNRVWMLQSWSVVAAVGSIGSDNDDNTTVVPFPRAHRPHLLANRHSTRGTPPHRPRPVAHAPTHRPHDAPLLPDHRHNRPSRLYPDCATASPMLMAMALDDATASDGDCSHNRTSGSNRGGNDNGVSGGGSDGDDGSDDNEDFSDVDWQTAAATMAVTRMETAVTTIEIDFTPSLQRRTGGMASGVVCLEWAISVQIAEGDRDAYR